ncbi:uncharacterized protein LOC127809389 [Diospyros lotus]|uniref:uncharacterized protein LOC127809389 n=1 Tax=Diospyros lotus TaxID=55363 RepID=UPI0022543658|nr:uncharacterized protein LOC127809389 [Diospyros lotus]
MKAAQDRQKKYADRRTRPLEFAEGDLVYLRATPIHPIFRHQRKGKLGSRYLGPYRIKDRVGPLTYRLELSEALTGLHDIFHVSQLRKHIYNPDMEVHAKNVELQPDMTFEVQPVRVLERQDRQLRRRTLHMVNVQWSQHLE